MRLSIIIPAYKVEQYIEKCIRSLESQDIPKEDYEIIVTNDGSPDRCGDIVEKLQQEFPNIILINQQNQGVSMARNNAMACAKGHYILPIDPDDYVVPDTFSRILSHVESNSIDVMYLGFEIFDANQNAIWHTDYKAQENTIYHGVDGYFVGRGHGVRDPDRSWGMLYRTAMLREFDINYPKNVPYLEDGLFLSKVFAVAEKVAFDHQTFYQRTTRKGSATNSNLFFTDKALRGFINAIKDIQTFSNDNNLKDEKAGLINHVVAKFVILFLSPSISKVNIKAYVKGISVLKKAHLAKLNTYGLRFLYKKHIKMYNFSKLLFPLYFRLTNHPIYLRIFFTRVN